MPISSYCGEGAGEAAEGFRVKIRTGGYYFGDSEDFVQKDARLSGEVHFTKKLFLSANSARNWFSQDSTEFSANGVSFVLGNTFGRSTQATVGIGLTDSDSVKGDGSWRDFSYNASLAFKPVGTGHMTLSYRHARVVYESKSLGALKSRVNLDDFQPSYYQWISERWSFWTGLGYAMYSDDNTRTSVNASLTFLFRPEPEFGLSYAFGYIGYEDSTEDYWDPQSYRSHNLILVLNQPLGRYLTFNLRASAGYSDSENEPNSWINTSVTFQPSRQLGLEATGYFMGNPGRDEGGKYSARTLTMDLIITP